MVKKPPSIPLDYDGVLLVVGDRVKSTPLGMPGETGEVVGTKGRCILVKLDSTHVTWRIAAGLWKKLSAPST